MSDRPCKISAPAREFYDIVDATANWHCKLSTAELQARGLRPSHFSLDGRQYDAGSLVHGGVLSIPDDRLRAFSQQATRVEWLHLHEIKSPVHPAFFDVDMSVNTHKKEWWTMLIAIVEAAELDHDELANSEHLRSYLKLPTLHPETTDLPYGMVERLREARPPSPGSLVCPWTWLDVARATLDPEAFDGVFVDATSPAVVRPLIIVLLMALGKITQQVARTFYPEVAEDDSKMQVFMVGNYSAEDHTLRFPENPEKRETKLGAHLYFRQLYVSTETQMYIWQAVVDRCVEAFPVVPGDDGAQAFWQTTFDPAPYMSRVGGLRMPFSLKAAPCKRCNNTAKRRACDWCGGMGRMSSPRYYGPLCRLLPAGAVDTSEKGLSSLFNRIWLVHMCTVRVAFGTEETPGAVLEGRRTPVNMHQVHRQHHKDRLGAARSAAEIKQFERKTGLKDGPAMQHVLATVNLTADMYGLMPEKPPALSALLPLHEGDDRFVALREAFPALLSELFHPCYLSSTVTAASIVQHSVASGEPKLINVFVRGGGACRCFNRVVDAADPAVAGDVPAGARGDVAGVPGRHSNWHNTVFFTINRQGKGHGQITQRCCNKQLKTNRRSSRASQSGRPTSCADWGGESRDVDRKHAQFVRDFFFTRAQQSDEQCRRDVVAQAKSLVKRHRKRFNAEIGATEKYEEYVSKVVKKAKGGRGRATEVSVADLDEDDDSGLTARDSADGGFNQFLF
jgi:hypothetical protein